VYVDDIVIIGNSETQVSCLTDKLHAYFVMNDLGLIGFFLGIRVTFEPNGLHLRQYKYIGDLLQRVHMVYHAPCISGTKLSKFDRDTLENLSKYRHVVRTLQYVTLTTLDIAYSVNHLCQHMQTPTTAHWTNAKRVLRYLKGSVDLGLFYSNASISLNAFCDSD
jgi:hypothetical protein